MLYFLAICCHPDAACRTGFGTDTAANAALPVHSCKAPLVYTDCLTLAHLRAGTAGNASVLVYQCKSFHLTQILQSTLSRNSTVISRRYNLTQHLVAHVTGAIHTGNSSRHIAFHNKIALVISDAKSRQKSVTGSAPI